MRVKAITISFLFFVILYAFGNVLLIHGETGTVKHDLSIFPKYQYGPADRVWNEVMIGIARAEAEYVRTVLRHGGIAADYKEPIAGFQDEAIYWGAVAKVLIYHADYDAARQAGKKAEVLLRQMAGLISGKKA